MNIFDFVTQDEMDDLPEEPQMAFMEFVRHAQNRLNERTKELDTDDQAQWQLLEEARYGFMNVVIAAAKRYGIEPFVSMQVPRFDKFGFEVHRQFKADLDHYLTQLVLDNSIRKKRDSVLIPPETKDKIRKYLHALKSEIDKADLTDAKRSALLDKLATFEKELDKKRLSLLAVTTLAMSILAAPGGIWASYEIVAKLTQNVLQTVGEAKAADDEIRKLPSSEKPKQLLPPREDLSLPEPPPSFRRDEMDEEIPF